MLDAFADPTDFCRTCRGDKWAEDGARCDVCGGTGLRTIAALPRRAAPLSGPELRAWRRDNPRCACGACDGLTVVSEGYHPEPPVYRCAACVSPSSPGPTWEAPE
jgi:hypothetical protein